jgi:hypothetical protein
VEQEAEALLREQVVPHPPQSELVLRAVSQPLAWFPSQFPNPELQEEMLQEPEAQVALALVREQEVPQVPQLVSELRGASHPLALLESQFPTPALQLAIWQVPVEQVAVAPAREQEVPHAPQLERVLTCVSQPLPVMPSQFPNPDAQLAIWQVPVEQVALAWLRLQRLPQLPQLELVFRLTSQPSLSTPLQSAKPVLHERIWQEPEAQLAVALARVQAVPHAAQLELVLRGVSQPLAALPSQLLKPLLQDTS